MHGPRPSKPGVVGSSPTQRASIENLPLSTPGDGVESAACFLCRFNERLCSYHRKGRGPPPPVVLLDDVGCPLCYLNRKPCSVHRGET